MAFGEEANNELGIAYRDIKTSEKRTDRTPGFKSQQDWSKQYLGERVFGLFMAFGIFLMGFVWAFSASALVRYGVTIAVTVIAVFFIALHVYRKQKLKNLRKMQVKELLDKNAENDS